jgi:hypothetical protein
MANRSYLYSSDAVVRTNISRDRKPIGIAEWSYGIPLVFKILLSGNPTACRSLLFDYEGEIALSGDFAQGVRNLEKFLSRIRHRAAQRMLAEARSFLHRAENQKQYFLLECGEIFAMNDAPLHEQNVGLIEEIKALDPRTDDAIRSLMPPSSWFKNLFGAKRGAPSPPPDPHESVRVLGFGNWSNHLYSDFSDG